MKSKIVFKAASNGQGFPPLQHGSKNPAQHTSPRCSGKLISFVRQGLCCLWVSDLDAEELALLEVGEGGGFRAEGETVEQGYTHYWNIAAHIVQLGDLSLLGVLF